MFLLLYINDLEHLRIAPIISFDTTAVLRSSGVHSLRWSSLVVTRTFTNSFLNYLSELLFAVGACVLDLRPLSDAGHTEEVTTVEFGLLLSYLFAADVALEFVGLHLLLVINLLNTSLFIGQTSHQHRLARS